MSMFDPYEKGEPIATLDEITTFVLVDGKVRPKVQTEHGEREPVDLVVQTTEAGKTRTFSGFSAGIVGQMKRRSDGDLPAVVRIVESPTDKGNPTKIVELVDKLDNGIDLAKVAAMQPTPIAPLQEGQTNAVPY